MMMSAWWWLPFFFMFIFLTPALGYGWGYRRWGAPYPSYIQRRRQAAPGRSADFNHQAWGFGGDLVWLVMLVGVVWVCAAFWWR